MKTKIQQVVWVIGLGLCTAFTLLQFELVAYHQAVALLEQIFYRPLPESQVVVPHKQETYDNLIKWTFGKDAKLALAVATAENGTHACNRTHQNQNGTVDIGIFQINSIHAAKGNLYDCAENVRIAYRIYQASGFSAWTVYKTGAYKKFLN